jgi:hypothetical protein
MHGVWYFQISEAELAECPSRGAYPPGGKGRIRRGYKGSQPMVKFVKKVG